MQITYTEADQIIINQYTALIKDFDEHLLKQLKINYPKASQKTIHDMFMDSEERQAILQLYSKIHQNMIPTYTFEKNN